MFRNKVLIRAAAADSSPLPPFRLRQLSLSAAAPIPALDLEILCCRLSRRHRLACLPQPPADALLVFQVGEEEALVCSGELVAKAVGCDLHSMMLEHGWRCLGESIYVDSKFDRNQERTDLCALNVEVRLGRNDDFEFVVSPDAFRYTTHKISDVASPSMMETFQNNNEVVLNICNIRTVCTTLPALQEGHVIGYSKMPPSEQCLDKFMELCLFKHGLDTNYDYHVAVKLTYGASSETKWLSLPQVTLLKPSFSRSKPAEKRKLRYSSEHPDADNSNKSSQPDPASSSSAILHIKDYTPSIQKVTKATPDIVKDVLTTKVTNTNVAKDEVTAEPKRKANQDLDKNVLTAVTKQKTMPEIVKNEFAIKVKDNQNDDLKKKVTKSRAKAVDKDLSNSTKTKVKPDVASDELIAKVIDHHKRGELRLLTVADLKCFLGSKKAKVGGTKEVLIQRVTELLA
ncbi:unnamed protein product [Urochloa decumbens]|uniref:SAP domain-containing protein n=1 Tax=Urochloa decumbens TaxID=240449 RepID=A0ABC8YFL6_9POAL